MIRMRLVAVLVCVFSAGCTTTTINEYQQAPLSLESQESVVILGRRHSGQFETEPFVVQCISDELNAIERDVNIIGEIDFLNRMYPWFEPRTAPLNPERLRMMMDNPVFAAEIEALNLHYMVWVEGSTQRGDGAGVMTCSIAPTGAACFGFGTWEDDASYEIAIWDVHNFDSVAWLSADATGSSYMPAFIIPIPLIARVKSNICESIADQIIVMFSENLENSNSPGS